VGRARHHRPRWGLAQDFAFFQHLLDMTPEQIDDIFRAAMEIEA